MRRPLHLLSITLAFAASAVSLCAPVQATALLQSYPYDSETRLTQTTTSAGGLFGNDTEGFTLNAVGNRIAHSRVAGAWLHDANNLLTKLGNGNPTAGYRYTYYHNDHLGTPQRLTDKAGNLLWSAQYDAYGKAQVQTTASVQLATVNLLRQPGQYLDLETGLHYNDRRYYDADTGRYASRDPIGFEGGINLYSYAGASPSRFTDPTGEFIPCMAASFVRCMVICGLQSAATTAVTGGCIDVGNIAKDCAVDCLLSMLPIPDPCGRFGKLFGAAVGVASGLANSFEQDTLVHTRVLTDSGYQKKLKAIKDIEVGDEVLAWDELQAHDNAAMAPSGQAAQTLQAAYKQADLSNQSAYGSINTGVSSYEIKSAQRYERVTETASSLKEQTLLHITLSNGQTIQATAGHPFKTQEGWRDAVLLKRGGQLLLGGEADAAERFATITDIREEVKTTAVFNLEVANLHTFFVGADGVVVHNGVVYCRIAPGRKPYIGKADDDKNFRRRQNSHDRQYGTSHEYQEAYRGPETGKALEAIEQKILDEFGGPTNKGNPNGGTENRRNNTRKR